MTSFTDSEKVEYALKTTLNITMSKFGYAPFNETPAPPRVFPSNVMSKDLIKYGEGDLDENGAYVSGHSQSGTIDTTLTTYESVLKYYKIVCPVTKKVSSAQLKDVLGSTSIQNVLGRDITSIEFGYGGSATSSNFWTKPVKNNFHTLAYFRGHYLDEDTMTSKFNYANSNYTGLNLAWNHIAAGTDVSAAIDATGNGTDDTKIVPHLKLFLQVQTAFQIGAANKENQCFGHTMMKNMLGLDVKIPVQVNVGEVDNDPSVTAAAISDITGPGVAAGNEWYTQSTAGTINFYAVGHTITAVDNARSPTDNPIDSSAPLITFLKYTGDDAGVGGLGGGGGGGGAVVNELDYSAIKFGGTLVVADMPWDDDYQEDYISFILRDNEPYVSSPGPNEIMKITGAGNVGIGTTTPAFPLHINCYNEYNQGLYIQAGSYNGADSNGGNFLFHQNQHSSTTSKALRLEEWNSSHSHKRTIMTWQRYTGNVGIGFHIPTYKLHVNGNTYIAGTLQATSTVTAPTFNGALSGTVTTAAQPNITSLGTLTSLNVASAGSALLPAYTSWIGDTNNTKRAWGTGYMHWTTDTAAWELTLKNGNVGIGTTSPAAKLEVFDCAYGKTNTAPTKPSCMIYGDHAGETLWVGHQNQTAGIQLGYDTIKKWGTNNVPSGPLKFNISGSTDMIIAQDTVSGLANVGIGTTLPYAKLICQDYSEPTTGAGFINTPTNFAWPIVVNNINAAHRYNTNYGCGIKFKMYYDNINDQRWSGIAGISMGQYSNYTGLVFYTCNNYVTTEKMRILHDGRVGIGTTTPSEKLEVNGKVLIGDVLLGEHYTADYFGIIHKDLIGDNDNYAFLCEKTGHTYVNCKLGKVIHLRENNESIMTLKGGKVGIGIADPTAPLHIRTTAVGDLIRFEGSGNYRAAIGFGTHFSDYPAGELNTQALPGGQPTQGGLIIQCRASDGEGAALWMNGASAGVVNPGDNHTWSWRDEDGYATNSLNYSWHITNAGALVNNSDIRLKENIRYFDDEYEISEIKEKYAQIKFCKYNWIKPLKDPSGVKTDHYGIIAQELEIKFPEMIEFDGPTDTRMLNQERMKYISYYVIQDLVKENQELKTEVATLKSELAAIKQHLGI